MIQFNSADVEYRVENEPLISNWIARVALKQKRKVGDINYLFCSDSHILEVNNRYLNHNYYTDIITFDYSENDCIEGDIYISVDTVRDNAERFNTTFQNEMERVIIHGVLHLCGQNDKSDQEQEEMTKKENESLETLRQMRE